jgi:D-alanyl-D-alanine carboxypeptidase
VRVLCASTRFEENVLLASMRRRGFSPAADRPDLDRSRLRRGVVTPAVVRAFRSIGWGWGGDWSGSAQDYMQFSASGH